MTFDGNETDGIARSKLRESFVRAIISLCGSHRMVRRRQGALLGLVRNCCHMRSNMPSGLLKQMWGLETGLP